jgi:hypothetical protein
MAYAVLTLCGLIQFTGIPLIGLLVALAAFVCWIIYWVRIAKYSSELKQHTQFAFGHPNPFPFANQFPGQSQQPDFPPPHHPNQ